MERLNGEKDGGKEGEEGAVGSGVRSRFLEPFNDIPEENEWRRRTPDGRNGVGFSWRRMANRVAQSWKMRLCVLESHSPACISPCARRILVSSSISLSLSAPLFSVSTCLSTYMRDRVIPYDRIIPVCAARSLSDFPRCGWQVRVGLCESPGKIWLAFAFEWNCILLSLADIKRDFDADRQYLPRNGRTADKTDEWRVSFFERKTTPCEYSSHNRRYIKSILNEYKISSFL